MTELVPGGNQELPDGALTLRVPGPFDLSALITGDDGTVGGDSDFVFFNQPSAPGVEVGSGGGTSTVRVDPGRLRPGATRVTLVLSAADPGVPLGALPAPELSVLEAGGAGVALATFRPPPATSETVLLLAEVYRRGSGWRLRALGQGYADGLAGVARDYGVDVVDDGVPPGPPPIPGRPPAYVPTLLEIPVPTSVPAWAAGPEEDAALVNAERIRAGAPPVVLDDRLTVAAAQHAAAMAAHGSLAVETPDGVSLYQRVGTAGFACLALTEYLVSGPRDTAGFLAYCLGDPHTSAPFGDAAYTHIGIGHAEAGGGAGDMFWVAVWASPLTPEGLARLTAEVARRTDAERAAAGLGPLAPDPLLARAAQDHSADMAARDFYSHTDPDGREPWDRARAAGARHRGVGENIACGQRSAAEVVEGWMNSPGHRANILRPSFTHLGVGYATGSRAGTYWTQLFGTAD
ncbi:CAP domain-containing protein [Streptomyces sp. 8L]|uniref:CAP domain-containing protein n=1 Tax=Streptomyces sp. 8L TaxID=2877242 RepID=UPI001CD565A6|nr:CAP domain-containing protein [Streptomyces sp. 8L]MCA1217571.1 CAP domain-containing protein [Streptomyces sp. 8L]